MDNASREPRATSAADLDADIFAPASAFGRARQIGASSSSSSSHRPNPPAFPWGSNLLAPAGPAPSDPAAPPFLPLDLSASGGGAFGDAFAREEDLSLDSLGGAADRDASSSSSAAHASSSSAAGGGDATTDAKKRNREHARQTRIRKKAYVAQVGRMCGDELSLFPLLWPACLLAYLP
jgi:hypothetical protein